MIKILLDVFGKEAEVGARTSPVCVKILDSGLILAEEVIDNGKQGWEVK